MREDFESCMVFCFCVAVCLLVWFSTTLHVALEVPAITSIKGTFFYAELAQKLALNVISTGSQVMKVLTTHVHADAPHRDCNGPRLLRD